MLAAAIRPLMIAEIRHWLPPTRDIHGRQSSTGSTAHAARVTHTAGSLVGPASRERSIDAAAVVWLLNHPRRIAIGDTFELPAGDTLKVIRAERRTAGADTLSKVYLS